MRSQLATGIKKWGRAKKIVSNKDMKKKKSIIMGKMCAQET